MARTTEDRIRNIVEFIAEQAGTQYVSIRVVREALGNPAGFDQAMVNLYSAQDVDIIPQSAQQLLTAEDRAAAVRCGGQDKHLVALAG
jgi:hypothetical protein